MVNEYRRSIHDYARDVERMIRCIKIEKSSYDANLYAKIGPSKYPVFPVSTPLGNGTLRVLGSNDAVFESEEITIYRVAYRVHAFVTRTDEGVWDIESGIRVLMRRDHASRWDDSRAARERFAKVALPVIAGVLDAPEMNTAREAAQGARLAWEIVDRERDVRRLDELIDELRTVRRTITDTIATDRREIAQIATRLASDAGSAANAA